MNRLEIFEKVYGKCEWHESALLNLMRVVDLVQESIEQAITDPENQPSQYGTVTLDMYEKLEREHELYMMAFKTVDEKLTECSNKLARLAYLVNKTYWIDDNNQLHQVLMDNLLADVAMEVLEELK